MPEITPQFVMQYERRMRAITENEYLRRLKRTWWNKIAKTMNIEGKTERITWLLNTATIEPVGPSGSGTISFDDLVTQTAEYPVYRHAKGLRIQKDQLEDLNGTGLQAASEWSAQIGNETAYYPQRLMAQLILNGANTDGSANAYDGKPFFSKVATAHPYNPYALARGTYANWLGGVAAGTYPGALPIDASVTTDVALANMGKAIAYIAGWKMPNGQDPRFLMPKYIVCPPALAPRVRQLTDAKIIAQAAASGGGGADVEAIVRGWALGEPIVADELAATTSYTYNASFVNVNGTVTSLPETVSGSDTTWYLVCEEAQTSSLGGLLHVMRKPFKVTYYSGDSGGDGLDAILDRSNELEYHVQGRMSAQYGHPYSVIRIDAT